MDMNQPNPSHDVFGSGPSSVGNPYPGDQFGGPGGQQQPGMGMDQPDMGQG